ncbi:MAG TPA: CpsB/CapC family capsule biosynthesis tyrosine phosphatase [Solirubrobacteraceae bacterium]|nr:CpsB/CapC family capsule biosynthesis tyrosine phosphatase [Solirubrobacteraceae bacterium]
MTARAELHFHLLPGVDDGPGDMAEAVELARLAVEDGTGIVCTTPHVRELLRQGILHEVPARVAEVRAALAKAGVPLEVIPGGEVAHEDLPALGDRELDAVAQGPPGRRWVLIEAPLFGDDLQGFLAGTAEIRRRGYGTLIGHPERCRPLMDAAGAIEEELRAGARLQVNGSSLTGLHGERQRAWAVGLVRAGHVHVMASDAHRPTRGPVLGAALAALAAEGIAGPAAEALAARNPRALLSEGLAAPSRRARAA